MLLTAEQIKIFKKLVQNGTIKAGTFDLETSYTYARIWDTGKQFINHKQLTQDRQIITAQFMYSLSKKPEYKAWTKYPKHFDDAEVVKWIINKIHSCDIIIAQNGKQFDYKVLQERAMILGLEPVQIDFMIDTLTSSRSSFKSFSHSLDAQSKQLGFGGKIQMEMDDWIDIVERGVSPLKKMVPYGLKDIKDTDNVFWRKLPYYNLPATTVRKILKLIAKHTPQKVFCLSCSVDKQAKYNVKIVDKSSTLYEVHCLNCGDIQRFHKVKE